MVTIEQPRLHGENVKDQLQQLQSYLSRTAQQLQWAFDTLQTGETAAPAVGSTKTASAADSFSPQAVFGGIKNLIIKSADIVNAYSDEIGKRLEGVYTAKSDFGTFQQETSQKFAANSQRMDQLFSSHQQISQTVEGLWNQAIDTNSYVRTGYLGEGSDGIGIYGLEIGQQDQVDGKTVFDRFARFTANRLSFFDSSNVEVAYISDYRLYITNAQISGSLHIGGRFRIYSGGGLIFQWTGGDVSG